MTTMLAAPGTQVVAAGGLNLSTRTEPDGTIWVLENLSGWYGAPKMRTTYTARPQAAGSYFTPAFADVREVTIDGTVYCPTVRQLNLLQRQLGVLSSSGLMPIQVTDAAGTLMVMAQRSSEVLVKPVGNNPLAITYSVTLTAPDPRLLDPVPSTVSTLMAQSSGLGIPWRGATGASGVQWRGSNGTGGILWRGAAGGSNPASGVLPLDNVAGTAPADIVFTIRGPVFNPTLSTANAVIRYGGVLTAADTLEINTGTGSVLLNGGNRRSYLTSAEFFTAPPGRTLDVRFSAEIQNDQASATATWQVSYL